MTAEECAMRVMAIGAMALMLAGCNPASPPEAENAAANDIAATENETAMATTDDLVDANAGNAEAAETPASPAGGWAGRWTGPEGLYLDIKPEGDGFVLKMKYTLDDEGTFKGRAEGDGIVFERAGKQETLRAATGDETGMKWLAGKKECVMVAVGEGYCRG